MEKPLSVWYFAFLCRSVKFACSWLKSGFTQWFSNIDRSIEFPSTVNNDNMMAHCISLHRIDCLLLNCTDESIMNFVWQLNTKRYGLLHTLFAYFNMHNISPPWHLSMELIVVSVSKQTTFRSNVKVFLFFSILIWLLQHLYGKSSKKIWADWNSNSHLNIHENLFLSILLKKRLYQIDMRMEKSNKMRKRTKNWTLVMITGSAPPTVYKVFFRSINFFGLKFRFKREKIEGKNQYKKMSLSNANYCSDSFCWMKLTNIFMYSLPFEWLSFPFVYLFSFYHVLHKFNNI